MGTVVHLQRGGGLVTPPNPIVGSDNDAYRCLPDNVLQLDQSLVDSLPREKWLLSSLLQKSIRRGHAKYAVAAAFVLAEIDARYVARRLPVIAYEDIGIANVPLALAVRKAAKSAILDGSGDGAVHAARFAGLLAESLKSRSTCDITCLCDFSPDLPAVAHSTAAQSLSQLVATVLSDQSLLCRAMALRGLLGIRTAGLPLTRFSTDARNSAIRELFEMMRLPRIIQEAVIAGTDTDALNAAIPLVHALLAGSQDVAIKSEDVRLLHSPDIGGVLGCAADMHTRVGLAAFRMLIANSSYLRSLLDQSVPRRSQVRCLGFLIFQIEGSVLDRRLSFREADELLSTVETVECEHVGLSDPHGGTEIRCWLKSNLALLNEARAVALARARTAEWTPSREA